MSLKFVAAVRSKRFIHISDSFKHRHPAIYEIFVAASASQQSKWIEISLHTFAEKKQGVYKSRSQVCALVSKADKTSAPYCGLRHVFEGPEFLRLVRSVDHSRSATGLNR